MTNRASSRDSRSRAPVAVLAALASLTILFLPSSPVLAEASVSIVAGDCSELGCCVMIGDTVQAQILAMDVSAVPLGGFSLDFSFDPSQLQLISVLPPGGGPFSQVPIEHVQSSPGVVSLGGLNCSSSSFVSAEMASLQFTVIAQTAAQTSLEVEPRQYIDASGRELQGAIISRPLFITSGRDSDCDGVSDATDNCPDQFNPDQDPGACAQLFAAVSSFEAEVVRLGRIIVRWETSVEIDNLGFNLYRSLSPSGPWIQVNPDLMLARGSSVEGAAYEYVDAFSRRLVRRSKTVFYQLEDIDIAGESTLHGPIAVSLRAGRGQDTSASRSRSQAAPRRRGNR